MAFDNRPCFFTIFFVHVMAQQLEIPQQFIKNNLKKVTASRSILTGLCGGRWAVEILKTRQDQVFLGNGWEKFVRDNLLQDRDFLMFHYDGDMCFSVEIFGKSGVPRLPKYATLGSSSSGLKRRSCQPAEDETPKDSGREKKNQQRPKVYRGMSTNLEKKLASECQPAKGKRAVKEEATSFASQFPFFKMIIRDYNVRQGGYTVNVPVSFTKKHFSKDKNKVILRSVEGKAFEVNCRAYDGSYAFGGGWRRFVDDNQLKVGDVCIFELVGEMELQFHIFNK